MSVVTPYPASSLEVPADAVVDPRIGASGPCLLALEDGTVFHGVAFGAPVAGGGDLVVNTSQTGYQEVCTDPSYAGQVVVMTYPLIGNHGRFADDDQSERPWLPGSSSAMPPPASSGGRARSCTCCAPRACPRSPASTRGAWRATCARAARCARSSRRPARWTATPRSRPPGPSRRGRTRTSSARSRRAPLRGGRRGPLIAVVDLGLKTNIVRSLRRRGARVRVLPHTATPGRRARGDVAGVVLSPGPGDPGTSRDRWRSRMPSSRRPAAAGHLPRPPDRRAGRGRRDAAPALRPPRREPPRARRGHRLGRHHRPEPRGRGRRRLAARLGGLLREPAQPQRRLGRGAAPSHAAHRDRPVPPRGIARPARRRRGLRPLPRPRRASAGPGASS